MAQPKSCNDYARCQDFKAYRVTSAVPRGPYHSEWTCARHIGGTVAKTIAETGLTPVIVPAHEHMGRLLADLAHLGKIELEVKLPVVVA